MVVFWVTGRVVAFHLPPLPLARERADKQAIGLGVGVESEGGIESRLHHPQSGLVRMEMMGTVMRPSRIRIAKPRFAPDLRGRESN